MKVVIIGGGWAGCATGSKLHQNFSSLVPNVYLS